MNIIKKLLYLFLCLAILILFGCAQEIKNINDLKEHFENEGYNLESRTLDEDLRNLFEKLDELEEIEMYQFSFEEGNFGVLVFDIREKVDDQEVRKYLLIGDTIDIHRNSNLNMVITGGSFVAIETYVDDVIAVFTSY